MPLPVLKVFLLHLEECVCFAAGSSWADTSLIELWAWLRNFSHAVMTVKLCLARQSINAAHGGLLFTSTLSWLTESTYPRHFID